MVAYSGVVGFGIQVVRGLLLDSPWNVGIAVGQLGYERAAEVYTAV